MDTERLQELAAINALGALEGADALEFARLMADPNSGLHREVAGFNETAAALALATARNARPSPQLKARILEQIDARSSVPESPKLTNAIEGPGFRYLAASDEGWRPLPVAGAYVKLLSIESQDGYAVVLGKLDPGTHYPMHQHHGPESIYMLSGDLHIGDQVLRAGDYHRADPGTTHGDNWSETGCTILIVLSTENLMTQMR